MKASQLCFGSPARSRLDLSAGDNYSVSLSNKNINGMLLLRIRETVNVKYMNMLGSSYFSFIVLF